MIRDNVATAREGAKVALQLRQRLDIPFDRTICVWDLAKRIGVRVTFVDRTSVSGLYVRGAPPEVLIGTHRPPGRRTFTGAHELGHHVFGHGTQADEYLEDEHDEAEDPDERLANAFAAHLLMPVAAVRRQFALRRWSPPDMTPLQAFVLAEVLGVGYRTFLSHAALSLQLLPWSTARSLQKVQPKDIQACLWPHDTDGRVIPVGRHWIDRPIDCEVDDVLLLPDGTQWYDPYLEDSGTHRRYRLAIARSPGTVSAQTNDGWSGLIRISRRAYVGFARWRHTPDPDGDSDLSQEAPHVS